MWKALRTETGNEISRRERLDREVLACQQSFVNNLRSNHVY